MEHFADSEWVDLVRGVLAPEVRECMDGHLGAGCPECLEAYFLWERLAAFAERESALEPPAATVRVVNTFVARRPAAPMAAVPGWMTNVMATLVFDTQQALVAGVRSGGVSQRHLLYAANPYAVDLYVENLARVERVLLTGQIADTARGRAPRGVTVTLSDGVRELASAAANDFGEFQLEFDGGPRLSLLVTTDAGDSVTIPLDALLDPAKNATV